MSKILRCKKCGDIIQSKHTHDMVWCKCGAVAIDGGDDYCKVTGNLEDMEFLAVEKDLNDMFVRCLQTLEDKDKEIAMLEKALELACEDIFLRTFPYLTKEDNPNHSFQILAEHFKTEAKKIIESKKMGVDPEELPDFD